MRPGSIIWAMSLMLSVTRVARAAARTAARGRPAAAGRLRGRGGERAVTEMTASRRFGAAATVLLLGLGAAASGLATGAGHAHPLAAPIPAEAADAASAAAAARRHGVPVEVADRRTETTRVFANPSGTWTLEEHVLPVRAFKSGRWVPIDTTLTKGHDGAVVPRAVPLDIRFSGGGGGPLVTLAKDGGELSLSWPEPLPPPRLEGDTATYPDVLPGVDLQMRVDSTGYSQLLVVHNAAAAANPQLRRLRFGTSTRGLTLKAGADGTSTVVDQHGTTVFASGTPMMWDSAKTGQRHRAMRLEVAPHELAVIPDAATLSATDLTYPLYIDPSYSSAQYLWTVVNFADGAESYGYSGTAWPRETMRVGKAWGTADRWRAFFNVRMYLLARAVINRAWFSITLDHSASCDGTAVQIWNTTPLNPNVGMTWNNSGDDWLGTVLDTRNGHANEDTACPQPDMLMEFESPQLTAVLQNAANAGQGVLGLGLRTPLSVEDNRNYYKKFFAKTARLNVEYNTPPKAPFAVSTVPPTPCGTASAPTSLGTATPTFSGVGYDPNADNVSSQLQLLEGETQISAALAGTVGSGAAFSWPAVPVGVLAADVPTRVFSYRARTRDSGGLFGPYSPRCYFTIDTVRPQPPVISSTDFPDGLTGKPVGESGLVTLTASSSDTDIAGFRYGYSPESTTMWIAGSNANTPITLWPSMPDDPFDVERTLYVRAVDHAGNQSPLQRWSLRAQGRVVTSAPVRDDANGDRRADMTIAFDQGNGRTAIWNLLARPGGFHSGYIGWDSGINGLPAHRSADVRGDFDGDGLTDLALLREDPDGAIRLFLAVSEGSRYQTASEPAATLTGFRLSHLKLAAGDFDADGDDDIAVFQGLAGNQTRLWSLTSHRTWFGAPVLRWDSGTGNLLLDDITPLGGDFDGDGNGDVAYLRATAIAQTQLWTALSVGGQLAAPTLRWDSGTGGFAADRAMFAVGDVDGDAAGIDEIIALYDDRDTSARLLTLRLSGGAWGLAAWWDSGAAGSFDAQAAEVAAGDYNLDGRADVATFTAIGGGVRRLRTHISTGTAFAAAATAWEGTIGDAAPTVQVDPSRTYRLIARHSDKCAEIPGARTTRGTLLDQWTCVATATHETFTLQRIGASPYYHLKTFNGMCVDIEASRFEDGSKVLQWPCGSGGPQLNQQFQLDQLATTPRGAVIRVVAVHSGKCLTVNGAALTNGATVVQSTCLAGPPAHQQFYLRPEP